MEIIYETNKLEEKKTCHFCPLERCRKGKAEYQITSYGQMNDGKKERISTDFMCSFCKDLFDKKEDKIMCKDCQRLIYRDGAETICACDYPIEKRNTYTPRITSIFDDKFGSTTKLQKEYNRLRWLLEVEREEVSNFHEKSKEGSDRQKQELLDEISQLKKKNEQLEKEIKQLQNQSQVKRKCSQEDMVDDKILTAIEIPLNN